MKFKQYKLTELVKQILERHPQTQDDDMELILKVWKAQGLRLNKEQEGFIHLCFPLESITRIKRSLQKKDFRYKTTSQDVLGFIKIPKV